MTFGFQSAVDIATNAIDCIHTTASSHGRVSVSYTHLDVYKRQGYWYTDIRVR